MPSFVALALAALVVSAPPGPAPSPKARAQVQAQPRKTKVLLITHPTLTVVKNYATLAKDKLLDVNALHIVGIYHEAESEDYVASHEYIEANHLSWMSLRPVRCHLTADDVYKDNACRQEFTALLNGADGLVLNGGADIQPSLYGQAQTMMTQVETPARHVFEVSFLVQALGSARAPDVQPILSTRMDFPILGICVGMQTLNVAGGGTLVQDIPTQIYRQHTVEDAIAAGAASWHRNHAHELGGRNQTSPGVMHPIHLTPEAPPFLRKLCGDGTHDPLVLSVHHQAVEQVAPHYSVLATSDDGKVIEMIGRKDYPNVLGIQFHPERSPMWDKQERALMDPASKQSNFIFEAMNKDPVSRAFNQSIWQWVTRMLLERPAKERPAAGPKATAK
jgi:putative glutamine amidotransferase